MFISIAAQAPLRKSEIFAFTECKTNNKGVSCQKQTVRNTFRNDSNVFTPLNSRDNSGAYSLLSHELDANEAMRLPIDSKECLS